MALIIGAMLIGYLGLLALLNGIFAGIFGMDLTTMVGYVFSPIAYMMGIPSSEILTAGSIMGTKLLSNEFVAILQLQPLLDVLLVATMASILSATLVGLFV